MNKFRVLGFASLLSAALLGCGGNNQNASNTRAVNNSANVDSPSAAKNSAASNRTAAVPENFWESAAQGGMAEVAIANLTLSKSQNEEIRKFAQLMIADHTKVNDELKALAAKKKVVLPTQMGARQAMLEDLNRLSGANFDREYVEAMVDNHEDDVELFKNESQNSKDAELKAFAAKNLPALQSHLRMIRDIQSRIQ